MNDILLNFDKSIFFFFQALQRPWLNYVLAWPTRLGEMLILIFLITFGILIFDRRGLRKIPVVVVAITSANWVALLLKELFGRPRPHLLWENVSVIFLKPGNPAFPSGHVAVIFAGAFILNHWYGKKMRWTYGIAIWVAVTRLYVGVHYPTDLLGGALLGMGCAFLACRYLKWPLIRE